MSGFLRVVNVELKLLIVHCLWMAFCVLFILVVCSECVVSEVCFVMNYPIPIENKQTKKSLVRIPAPLHIHIPVEEHQSFFVCVLLCWLRLLIEVIHFLGLADIGFHSNNIVLYYTRVIKIKCDFIICVGFFLICYLFIVFIFCCEKFNGIVKKIENNRSFDAKI